MKRSYACLALALAVVALAGCADERQKTPGEAAGQAAYTVKKDAEKAAKEIKKDLKSFTHDAKEGYQEAKQKEQIRKTEKEEK